MAKAASSRSPLGNPKTLIHHWAVAIQKHLYLPDPSPFYIVLGTLAANMMVGTPVWLMLVGAGGSGRTRAIDSIRDVPRVKVVGGLESRAALISGSGKKDKTKESTGGLLFEIGQRGIIAPKDFTTTLSGDPRDLTAVVGALREVADGDWNRPLGTDGGKSIEWSGTIGFIGACTSALDRFHKVIGELGQRWIIYRYDDTDGYQESLKALGTHDELESMSEIRRVTGDLVTALSLEFSCWGGKNDDVGAGCEKLDEKSDWYEKGHKCSKGPTKRELTEKESRRITALGTFVARARSIVPRDDRTHDVIDMPSYEPPMRLNKALGKLYLGLELVGLGEDECWRLVTKVAWDSVTPRMRAMVLKALKGVVGLEEEVRLTFGDVELLLDVAPQTVKRVLGDLKILKLIEHPRGSNLVWVSGWSKDQLRLAGGMDE